MSTSTLRHHPFPTELYTSLTQQITQGERRLRRSAAWLMLVFLLFAELGLAWDTQWHALIGRDRFWTPPHLLIYIAVGGAGLTALLVVVVDTLRYSRSICGATDASTVRVLGIFHAPLGFVLAGCGPLIDVIAAPFDNYWHQLYGIDITLWSPFHLMGVIGGIIGGLGLVTAFASELVIDRYAERLPRTFLSFSSMEWGVMLLLSALLRLTFASLTQFPTLAFGNIAIVTYPLPLTLGAGLCLVGAIRFTRKMWTGAIIGMLVMVHTLLSEAFVPWAVRVMVTQMDLHYRFPGRLPFFNVTSVLVPLVFLVAGLLVDGIVMWQRRHGGTKCVGRHGVCIGMLVGLPVIVGTPIVLQVTMRFLPQGVVYMPVQTVLPLVVTLPLVLILGAFAGMCGEMLGAMWTRNRR